MNSFQRLINETVQHLSQIFLHHLYNYSIDLQSKDLFLEGTVQAQRDINLFKYKMLTYFYMQINITHCYPLYKINSLFLQNFVFCTNDARIASFDRLALFEL